MKTVKTPKGTELQVMSLKGKDYMQVQQRLIWFVEENPRYDITTDFVKINDEEAVAKCTVSILEDTPQGVRVVRKVTDYKSETQKGFADFIEKSCTGALGRCLASLGYGTQFAAADLDEGERIVDSPVATKPSPTKATKEVAVSSVKAEAVETSTASTTETSTTPAAIPSKPANRFARKPAGEGFKL